jgi:divalent metal cation (Fe/Co/Zn/Cd) transporter
MSVRVSPVSKIASVLIIILGLFLLLGGWAAGEEADIVAGVAVTVLGVVLYRLLYRFSRKVQAELEGEGPSQAAAGRT